MADQTDPAASPHSLSAAPSPAVPAHRAHGESHGHGHAASRELRDIETLVEGERRAVAYG